MYTVPYTGDLVGISDPNYHDESGSMSNTRVLGDCCYTWLFTIIFRTGYSAVFAKFKHNSLFL